MSFSLLRHFSRLCLGQAHPGDIPYSKNLFLMLFISYCGVAAHVREALIKSIAHAPEFSRQTLFIGVVLYQMVYFLLLYWFLRYYRLQARWVQASCNYLGLDLLIMVCMWCALFFQLSLFAEVMVLCAVWWLYLYAHITSTVFNTSKLVALGIQLLLLLITTVITRVGLLFF